MRAHQLWTLRTPAHERHEGRSSEGIRRESHGDGTPG